MEDAIMSEKETKTIDLSMTNKTRFSVNNDPERVIWLNLSDRGIVSRLADVEPKLQELLSEAQNKIENISDEDDAEAVVKLGEALKEIDQKMREQIDAIFGEGVSRVCAPEGTMYDMFNGNFRFEYIIEALIGLYSENINKEYKALKDRTSKYTGKYSKKSKK